ncbi:MAG TPA: hypothetical protein DCR44_03080 [Acholeplasmatales bacterium]|nr:hypothetical protein [Acholeplasmatales bacterium]
MKRFMRMFVAGLTMLAVLAIAACGTTETTTTAEAGYPLAGEYEIDITDLGMPLIVYLKIDEEENFYLSPDRTFEVDKGHGIIGQSGDTYMFIYSDSTAELSKTCTFTFEDHNIHFVTALPYGASNLHASVVDEDNPDITYYLVAKVFLYEAVLGDYAGSHTVSAMGSEVVYDYSLKLKTGCEYAFVSRFKMGGADYVFEEAGTFAVDGSVLTVTPEGGAAVEGAINVDGSLDLPIKASEMGERANRHLRVALTSAYAGTYTGYVESIVAEVTVYAVSATLVLDQFGGYTYAAIDAISAETLNEVGTFSVVGTVLTLTPSEGTAQTGTLVNYVLTAPFQAVADPDDRVSVVLYRDLVQGVFTGSTTVEEVDYEAVLTVLPDGTYTLVVSVVGGAEILNETGTIKLTKTLFVSLGLTAGLIKRTCVVSSTGLNANFVIDEVTYGFILVK